tara:strand:- start:4646 stop:4831 length:186 start_codon:yes stop_codon:yes gene_type:complete
MVVVILILIYLSYVSNNFPPMDDENKILLKKHLQTPMKTPGGIVQLIWTLIILLIIFNLIT